MVIFLLIEIFNEILDNNEPLAHRHTIKVLSEFENLLFSNTSTFYYNNVLKLFLPMVFG